MPPHVIRLRGPWQYQPLARTVMLPDGMTAVESGPLPPPGQTRLPDDWGSALGADFRGRVRFSRQFHCPTGLGPKQSVRVVVGQADAWGRVSCNGQLLGETSAHDEAATFEIRSLLRSRNTLTVEVELPRLTEQSAPLARPAGREGLPGGLIGAVWLEIG